ncbi:MAG: Maf-like protein, partial [Rhodobacteraceae bacterium]|nr:Maf-like protein [Paracoccaceae bacterium]
DVRPPDVDETPLAGELPRNYCNRVTRLKVDAIELGADEVALCGDTTVALGRQILGKPADMDEARAFLQKMSGRRHRVITSVAVKKMDTIWQKDCVSIVKMKVLGAAEIDAYLTTGDWEGKAGGYGIQGPAGAFVPWISGSYSAIMGLPVAETYALLNAAGISTFGARW